MVEPLRVLGTSCLGGAGKGQGSRTMHLGGRGEYQEGLLVVVCKPGVRIRVVLAYLTARVGLGVNVI